MGRGNICDLIIRIKILEGTVYPNTLSFICIPFSICRAKQKHHFAENQNPVLSVEEGTQMRYL